MKKEISSTEAVRNFSELLNEIKYRGDRYAVIRGGKPAASPIPVEESRGGATLARLPGIVRALPRLDSGDTGFEADVMATAGIRGESDRNDPRIPIR